MQYLGLDCSTKAIHGVWLDEEGNILDQRKWASKDKKLDTRFVEILSDFDRDLSKITISTLIAVEASIYIQNPRTTVALASVVAGVKYICHRLSFNCMAVDNKVCNKQVLQNGKADKAYIKKIAMEKWPDVNSDEQDFCDAACIALWRKMEDENADDISL